MQKGEEALIWQEAKLTFNRYMNTRNKPEMSKMIMSGRVTGEGDIITHQNK